MKMNPNEKKNVAKGLSYKEAWRRIRDANEEEFYFEAVTICESIISDRLWSYLVGNQSSADERTSFANLITDWKKRTKGTLPQIKLPGTIESVDLGEAVDAWRKHRNAVVHGIVKSKPGTPTKPIEQFLEEASQAARDGEFLARRVSDWHKKQLREHRRNQSVKTDPPNCN